MPTSSVTMPMRHCAGNLPLTAASGPCHPRESGAPSKQKRRNGGERVRVPRDHKGTSQFCEPTRRSWLAGWLAMACSWGCHWLYRPRHGFPLSSHSSVSYGVAFGGDTRGSWGQGLAGRSRSLRRARSPKKKIRLELWRDNGIRARMSAPMFCFVVDKRVLSNLTCGRRVLTSQVSAGLLRPARQGPWLAGSAAQQAKLGSRYEGDLVGPLRCYSVCPGTAKSPVVGVESIHLLC